MYCVNIVFLPIFGYVEYLGILPIFGYADYLGILPIFGKKLKTKYYYVLYNIT